MKVKIIKKDSPTGKDWSLLKKLKKCDVDIDGEFENIGSEFEKSFDSVGSNVKVINGTFSDLKPIEGPVSFTPKVTSTPINYEDITDDEIGTNPEEGNVTTNPVPSTSKMKNSNNIQDEDLNLTFNFQQDVLNEKESCEKYMNDLAQFISRTQDMVENKVIKRTLLIKKIRKYQKKIRTMETTLNNLDKMIAFGTKVPKLLDNV